MSKHSEGPWYVEGHEVKICKPEREHLGDGAPETICEMISSVSPEETRANQALIAAAPDLLAACKEAELLMHAGISLGMEGPERDAIDSENAQQCGDILQRIKAAIAKAGQPARKEQDR